MKHFKHAGIRGLVAGLFVTMMVGCGDEGPSPQITNTATLGEASNCAMVDATDPEVTRSLEGAKLMPLGSPTEQHVDGRKVSTLHFRVESTPAAQSVAGASVVAMTEGTGTITCAVTCTGKNCGSPEGCVAMHLGCTAPRCSDHCVGACTKTTVYTPGDAGVSDAGTSDAGASDSGVADAGASDAGASDAGASDAGAAAFR